MAREPGNRETRRVYTKGVNDCTEWLATEGQDGITRPCAMPGALVLARATKGSPLRGDPHHRALSSDGNQPQRPASPSRDAIPPA